MQRTICALFFMAALSGWSQPVLAPGQPALTPSNPFVPGSPVLANDLNPPPTNASPATNLTVAQVGSLLTNLEAAVQNALPAVAAFNDNFVISNGAASLAVNPAANAAGTLGSNTVTSVTAAAPAGLLNAPASTPGSVSATLRSLIVLQSELQEMLPTLNALNGGTNFQTNGLSPAFVPGTFTNLFRDVSP